MPSTPARKPRILLIPNMLNWILGDICLHIQRAFADRFDFVIIPENLFELRPQLWDCILPRIDLIHCVTESSAGILADVFRERGALPCPVVTWIHHVTSWSPAHQAAAQLSDALIVSTQGWKRFVAGHTAKPVLVVRYGVDSERFTRIPAARQQFSIPGDAFVAGFFASKASDSDGNRKGTDVLMGVMTRCAPHIPGLRILLLGPGWDPRAFEEAGVAVTYPGFISAGQLPAAYSALDVYLMTARVEGGPVTVLEAMACGTPVVATRVGLVPDAIVDGQNGFSADAGDVDGLSHALLTLAADPLLRARLADEARKTALQLGWETTLAPLAGLYEGLLAGRHLSAHGQDLLALNRSVRAADAILGFRYALHRDLKARRPGKSVAALRALLPHARWPATLLRGYRLAAHGRL